MNPIPEAPQKAKQLTTRDIVPPRPQPPAAQPPVSNLRAEIVKDIPVKNPIEPPVPPATTVRTAVMAPAKTFVESSRDEEDRDLDRILRDVNKVVKKADKPDGQQPEAAKKAGSPKTLPKPPRQNAPPIMAITAACLVAVGLIVSAFMVFKNGS